MTRPKPISPVLELQLTEAASGQLSNAIALHKRLSKEKECGIFWSDGYVVADLADGDDAFVYIPLPASMLREVGIQSDPGLKSYKNLWELLPVNLDDVRRFNGNPEKIAAQMLLHQSIQYSRPDLLAIALKQGADVNFAGFVEEPIESVMSLWLKKYIDVINYGNTQHGGVMSDTVKTFMMLLETGKVDLNKTLYATRISPSRKENPIASDLIMSFLHTCNRDTPDSEVQTTCQILRILFQHGADVHYRDLESGATLPMIALKGMSIRINHLAAKSIMQVLFEAGADPEQKNNKKRNVAQEITVQYSRFKLEHEQNAVMGILNMVKSYSEKKATKENGNVQHSGLPIAPADQPAMKPTF